MKMKLFWATFFVAFFIFAQPKSFNKNTTQVKVEKKMENTIEKAVLGAGCFWCVEAIFQRLNGVISVLPGYSGGKTENPTYEQVCQNNTEHVEVAEITFDSKIVSFEEILEVFWATHDPTTLNRQGEDVGEQYRSVIFYVNENQREVAAKYKNQIDNAKIWKNPIVTTIEPLIKFWSAENYHRDYFNQNSDKAYCQLVVRPKVEKFKNKFENKLKK